VKEVVAHSKTPSGTCVAELRKPANNFTYQISSFTIEPAAIMFGKEEDRKRGKQNMLKKKREEN